MITASIVLFKENLETLTKTIDCFLEIDIPKKLYLIDNSPQKELKKIFNNDDIKYIFNNKNLGFGKAHNLVLNRLKSDYHLILNPDVEFNKEVVYQLIKKISITKNVSFISPKVLYPDGKVQLTCRKHPTFTSLFLRKFTFSKNLNRESDYNLQSVQGLLYPEFIHGCFMLFKTKDLKQLKGFDERYFLYMEDADICRKIENSGKKIMYFPEVSIIHQHRRSSSKNLKLFLIHTSSAIKYFLKWGF